MNRFLWIHFQLIDLCGAMSSAQIRNTLQNLPDGLGDTYGRILKSISRVSIKARLLRESSCGLLAHVDPCVSKNCKKLWLLTRPTKLGTQKRYQIQICCCKAVRVS